jgi:hypothetical protein
VRLIGREPHVPSSMSQFNLLLYSHIYGANGQE